jgi:hypothetical protein
MRRVIVALATALAIVTTSACGGGSPASTLPQDWYAQDSDGNVWYLGEDTTEYENGELKPKEGSWEAGVDGALGGIIVPAHPEPGLTYREEYYEGHAEDGAEVHSLHAHAEVPYGTYDNLLQTRNFSPIEPDVVEEKF